MYGWHDERHDVRTGIWESSWLVKVEVEKYGKEGPKGKAPLIGFIGPQVVHSAGAWVHW
jgi:hypothetical protein